MSLHLPEPVGVDPRADVVFLTLFGSPEHDRFFNEAERWREVPTLIDTEAMEEAMATLYEFQKDVALNEIYRGRIEAERVELGRQKELEEALAAVARVTATAEGAITEAQRERAEKEQERAEKLAVMAELKALRASLGLDASGERRQGGSDGDPV